MLLVKMAPSITKRDEKTFQAHGGSNNQELAILEMTLGC